MAVAVNSEMPSNVMSNGTAASSLTYSFTNTAGTFLAICVQSTSGVGISAISSVTYGGVTCTLQTTGQWDTNATPNNRLAWYTLASPATGANNVVVTMVAGTSDDIISGAISVTGDNGTVGVKNTGFNDSGSSSHSLSLAGTTSGSLCLLAAGCGAGISTRSLTLSAAKNVSTSTSGDNSTMDRTAGTGGTVTDNWTSAASDLWGSAGIEILPSGGGGGVTQRNLTLMGVGMSVRLLALSRLQQPLGKRTFAKVLAAMLWGKK